MNPVNFDLCQLIHPVDSEEFKHRFWEQNPLLIKRTQPNYYLTLLTISDVERLLPCFEPGSGAIRVVKDGNILELDGPGIGVEKLLHAYRAGATIVLQGVHKYWRPLTKFCNSLAYDLSCDFQANAYLTPPTMSEARGLGMHYDTHDVFVLQLTGSKHWRVYDSPVRLPLENQFHSPGQTDIGKLHQEFDLNPGDCVYIPRGYYHEAMVSGTSSASLHLTVGVHPIRWVDFIKTVLQSAAERDVRLRTSLPLGFANDDACSSVVKERFLEILKILAEDIHLSASIEKTIIKLNQQLRPVLDGHLIDLETIDSLNLQTVVWRRTEIFSLITLADFQVSLHFHGKTLKMPDFVEPALRFMIEVDEFNPAQLPSGIDEAGKLVLVRRLVKEGFLTIIRPVD